MAENTKQIKVFGIGLPRSGTSTLGTCFKILKLTPTVSYNHYLHHACFRKNNLAPIYETAEKFKSFQDSPWCHMYREFDKLYPGSKFILTVRKDSVTYAKSVWYQRVRAGFEIGEPKEDDLRLRIERYEKRNQEVLEYFKERPEDLITICWENGDGWDKLCRFLGMPLPGVEFPHSNPGLYKTRNPGFLLWMRVKYAKAKIFFAKQMKLSRTQQRNKMQKKLK